MLIDLLPTPPPEAVIGGVLLWDFACLWAIWWASKRPAKRHRFKAPAPAKRRGKADKIERVYTDLW